MESKHKPIFSQFLATGSGGSGQLLLGDLEDYTTFLPVDPNKISPESPAQTQNFLENLVYISLGGTKALGLTNQGEVYSWGETTGKTGDKVNIEPVRVLKSPLKVLKISCGWAHNICLTDASQVYVWGEGKFGQLGLGKERLTYISDPNRLDIDTIFKLLDVKAGFRQSYIITNQNYVLCCGSNKSIELGKETEEGVIASPLLLDLTGIIQHEIVKVSTGQRHVVVMNNAGDLYGWGDNKYGQLGNMSEKKKAYSPVKLGIEKIREISCGWNHTLALSEDREVYITGRGNFGQQGNGRKEDAVGFHKDAKIKHIVSGSEASYVVTEEDEIYVWGWNEHGNLGTGNKEDSDIPVKLEIDSKGKDPTLFCGGAAVILAFK